MVGIRLRVCYPESSDKKATPKESVTPCQRKKRLQVVRKATVYDLQKILDKGEKGKTYTVDEIKDLMDAYVVGAEQSYPRRGGQPPQPKEDTLSSTYLRIIVARC
jgi:hypothetical protein